MVNQRLAVLVAAVILLTCYLEFPMGNGMDDWTGPKLKSEVNDQAVGQMHDFGACTQVDGKNCLSNEITKSVMSLGKLADNTAQQPDITIPGGVDNKSVKTGSQMASMSGDPATPGGLDTMDAK